MVLSLVCRFGRCCFPPSIIVTAHLSPLILSRDSIHMTKDKAVIILKYCSRSVRNIHIVFPGTNALFVLQSLPHQHQCRCCPYFRFSVIRIPFSFRFLVSPSFLHPLQLQRESGASRILLTTCSYSGKMVVRTAGVLVSKSTNISFSSVIISAKNGG